MLSLLARETRHRENIVFTKNSSRIRKAFGRSVFFRLMRISLDSPRLRDASMIFLCVFRGTGPKQARDPFVSREFEREMLVSSFVGGKVLVKNFSLISPRSSLRVGNA